jgi:hypothetical protein
MPNVKIVSDGTSYGTKILNAETGEQLPGYITGIDWSAHLEVDKDGHKGFRCFATVIYVDPELDVQVDESDLVEADTPLKMQRGDDEF